MIKIGRPSVTSLPALKGWAERSAQARQKLLAEFATHGSAALDQRIWQLTRDVLAKVFHSKCAACESRVGISAHFSVEHFRPKSPVVDAKSSQGYWWLAYDWSNLFALC